MLSMEEQFMIRHLYNEGLSTSEISRRTGRDPKTVRKYRYAKGPKRYTPRPPRPSILDSHKEYIKERLGNYPLSAVRILEEIRERGY